MPIFNFLYVSIFFYLENLKTVVKDYQEIKLQEKLDIYSAGTIPRSIVVILENDLVDSCKPGDDVTIKFDFIYLKNLSLEKSIYFVWHIRM